MKKVIKIILKVLLSIIGLILVVAIIAAVYINSSFLNFHQKDRYRNTEIKEITRNDFTFKDLNRNGELDIYEDERNPLDERVSDLLSQMNDEEKIGLLVGIGSKTMFPRGDGGAAGIGTAAGNMNRGATTASGTTAAIPRLGIPAVILNDGPAGLRINPTRKKDDNTYYCTAFPIGTQLASTWNTDLVEQVGKAMGSEVLEYGYDVILGPGANIQRNPLCGRNFEYYSEDPVVTGLIGAAMVNGIESNGIGASVKHFVANNQETDRNKNNVIVSERALREIYLKGFEIIVKKAQPWTIMSSYNKVNGTYTSESRDLLTDILRDDWGFEGIVMTDWFGGSDAPAQVHAGNDLLEPGVRKQYKTIREAADNGTLSMEDIDTNVRRLLKFILGSRKMEAYHYSNDPDLDAHSEIARQSAAEGLVLLKNNGALPFTNEKNIALFGITSYNFIAGGTGSGDVNEAYTVSLDEGLREAGYTINTTAQKAFEAHKAANSEAFEKREGLSAMLSSAIPPEMIPSDELLAECAESADLAIVTIGRNSGEGMDRVEKDDFLLSADEQEMIQSVCDSFHEAGKKVVVVLNIGGVVETASWKGQPDAILLAWQGGQEGGNAVTDVLCGKVDPSGRLPMTFAISLGDYASTANFPLEGKPLKMSDMLSGKKTVPEEEQVRNLDYTKYEEGIYVGYRHFDNGTEVSYPFGYGLSYTDFAFRSMDVSVDNGMINISVLVENSGETAGKEVVEIFVSKPDSDIDRPVQELKAFAKTPLLNSGETAEVNMNIPISDLSYWDEDYSDWAFEKGTYVIRAASSSRDIRLYEEINL